MLAAHPLVAALAAFWLFSAFVSGMPKPAPSSSRRYLWIYGSLNALAANLRDLLHLRFPMAPLPEEPPPDPSPGRLLQMPSQTPETPRKSA